MQNHTLLTARTRLGQLEGGRPGPEAPRLLLGGRLADGSALPALPPRVHLHMHPVQNASSANLPVPRRPIAKVRNP
jgi:hypothetical protein